MSVRVVVEHVYGNGANGDDAWAGDDPTLSWFYTWRLKRGRSPTVRRPPGSVDGTVRKPAVITAANGEDMWYDRGGSGQDVTVPRLVDHTERRSAILEVTWRLIAMRGAEAATMREIARRAGYANGALTHYFPNKEALIEAAYVHVSERTDERIRAAMTDKRGLAALRAFMIELIPTVEVTRLEARTVLQFWSRTVANQRLAQTSDLQMQRWREDIVALVQQGRRDGEVHTSIPDALIAEQLMAMAMGLQVLALLPDHATSPTTQLHLIDTYLIGLARTDKVTVIGGK